MIAIARVVLSGGDNHVVAPRPDRDGIPEGFLPLRPRERGVSIALCRPIATSASDKPATVCEIAHELNLAEQVVGKIIAELATRAGLVGSQRSRAGLAAFVLDRGVFRPEDFLTGTTR